MIIIIVMIITYHTCNMCVQYIYIYMHICLLLSDSAPPAKPGPQAHRLCPISRRLGRISGYICIYTYVYIYIYIYICTFIYIYTY